MSAIQVYITGKGVISPLGHSADSLFEACLKNQSGVRGFEINLQGLDAAWVPVASCDFDDKSVKTPSKITPDRGTAMALVAAKQAFENSGLNLEMLDHDRTGLFWGSGMSGAHSFESICRQIYNEHQRLRPTTVLTTMPNAAVAEIALALKVKGHALGYACACASSAVAIGEAVRAIRGGWLDVAIVGGHESMLMPGILSSWQAMRVLSPIHQDLSDAYQACRPFAKDRHGFAMGEGAGALVLESETHTKKRQHQTRIYLSGYATNCDSEHITHPNPQGQVKAMRNALRDAGLTPQDIGYVNAHGTGTQSGDAAEAASLAEVFGVNAVPVSSTKAVHGHLIGAGGVLETIIAVKALECQQLPATAHVQEVDPKFNIDLIQHQARHTLNMRHVMSNSFAFGGTNAVLIASLA
jgi:3-oxoacyl-[acyl-carrier-protein] synthase II